MKKVMLAKGFEKFESYIQAIDKTFIDEGTWIRDARNKIKRMTVDGDELCVKSFGKPTVFNRLMYSYFRKSKAQRSYEYAQKLLDMGIGTPAPIAYVEVYNRWHFLTKAYYISRFETVDFHMAYVLNNDVSEKEAILGGFVRFMANGLHPNGVWHKDFNGANVLVKQIPTGAFTYSLVDLNRIKFGKAIGYHQGLRNMQQISSNPVYLTELARHYARLKEKDEAETIYELLFVKYIQRLQKRYTKRFLHSLKSLL